MTAGHVGHAGARGIVTIIVALTCACAAAPVTRGGEAPALPAPTTRSVPLGGKPVRTVAVERLYTRSLAVVIGIDRYAHLPTLGGAVHDARAVAEVLAAQGFEVKTFIDGDATRDALTAYLGDELRDAVGPDDRVLVFFAGHGITLGDGDAATGYLAPVDADARRIVSSGISMTELQRWFSLYQAKHVLLIADACYSGLAIGSRAGGVSPDARDYVFEVAQRRARIALTAGSAGEEAHEYRGHGLFTYFLLQGLAGAADVTRDGIITSDELAAFLKPAVTRTARQEMNASQTPQVGRSGEGEFLFAGPRPPEPPIVAEAADDAAAASPGPPSPPTPPTPNDLVLALARLARVEDALARTAEADAHREEAVSYFAAASLPKDGGRAAAAAAEAQYALAERAGRRLLASKPAGGVAALPALMQELVGVREGYERVATFGAVSWELAAWLAEGRLLRWLARYVEVMPLPPGAGDAPEAVEAFRGPLREHARRIEGVAIGLLQHGHRLGVARAPDDPRTAELGAELAQSAPSPMPLATDLVRDDLQACYAAARARGEAGEMVQIDVELTIGSLGRPEAVTISGIADAFAACVKAVAERIALPRTDPPVTVRYPVVLVAE